MSVTELLRKAAFLFAKERAPFEFPVAQQMAYINHFDEPKSDIDRSFYQYKSQMYLNGKPMTALMNLAALPLTAWYLLPKKQRFPARDTVEAVFVRDGKPDNIMPDCLRSELSSMESDPEEGFLLLKQDRRYIAELFRQHPVSWLFLLKNIIKIGRYRYFIACYHPKKLVVCNEYSFTSSVLTDYCEKNGVELINVMHGEKLYGVDNCFFRFHRCYVWDDHYVQMFRLHRAEPNQFLVARPKSLHFEKQRPETPEYDYTYYFQEETDEELRKIQSALRCLAQKGARISLRPHPRYSNMDKMNTMFGEYNIENYRQVSIEESVLRTRCVISGFSTVLQQAYYNGIAVVIDDVSAPDRIAQLKETGYIMLSKEHALLSSLVGVQ